MCFRFLILTAAVMLALPLAGCGNGGNESSGLALDPGTEDPWPLGDGSSWDNVMEAGFNGPAPESPAVLAVGPSTHIHFNDELSQGNLDVSLAGLGRPFLPSAGQVATPVYSCGDSRLLQVGLKPGSGGHIALSDRFWSMKPGNDAGGTFDAGRSSRVGPRSCRGGRRGGGISSRADVPNHFWIFF